MQKAPRSILQLAASLKHKKYRQSEGLSIAEGAKLTTEALKSGVPARFALFTAEAAEKFTDLVNDLTMKGVDSFIIGPGEMKRVSPVKSPSGCVLVYRTDFQPPERSSGLILGLYRVSDPGNLGSLLRTADWLGISRVALSTMSAELHNPATVRGSMGAVFRLPVECNVNIIKYAVSLKSEGWRIVIPHTQNGDKPKAVGSRTALFMGDEQGQLPVSLVELADYVFTIPRRGKGESLNLAAAGAILLYAMSKNR